MRKLSTLEWAGIAALLYFGLQYLGSAISSKIGVGKILIKVKNLTFSGVTVELTLPIINNTDISLPVSSFYGQLLYGTYALADLQVQGPVSVAAKSTTPLFVDAAISFAELSGQLVSMIQSGEWINALRVKGTLNADGLNIPVNQPLTLA